MGGRSALAAGRGVREGLSRAGDSERKNGTGETLGGGGGSAEVLERERTGEAEGVGGDSSGPGHSRDF